jgi:hypothetical protein
MKIKYLPENMTCIKAILIVFFLTVSNHLSAQNSNIQKLISSFKQPSFYEEIHPSKLALENCQKEIIPELIKMLKDTSFVKLTNTADLIYPGATEFYGHGHYIPYDIDWIYVRAGWLLENLTFQDFGYTTTGVDDEYLFELMKENYETYMKKGSYELEWKNRTPREKRNSLRSLQAKAVEKWWKDNKKTWNRLDAIKTALSSGNKKRVSDAVQFLRYGETKCDGLNKEVFRTVIKPLAMNLKGSSSRESIRENLFMIESEDLDYWTTKTSKLK